MIGYIFTGVFLAWGVVAFRTFEEKEILYAIYGSLIGTALLFIYFLLVNLYFYHPAGKRIVKISGVALIVMAGIYYKQIIYFTGHLIP